jgi:hypothetical protein
MANPSRWKHLRHSLPSPIAAGKRGRQRAVRPHRWQPAANPPRRFSRVTLGFWLGGIALGTTGCVLGACMPYRHPVAVTISVLWWGIYLGCFGAGIGALIGTLTKRGPAALSRVPGGASEFPNWEDLP